MFTRSLGSFLRFAELFDVFFFFGYSKDIKQLSAVKKSWLKCQEILCRCLHLAVAWHVTEIAT